MEKGSNEPKLIHAWFYFENNIMQIYPHKDFIYYLMSNIKKLCWYELNKKDLCREFSSTFCFFTK